MRSYWEASQLPFLACFSRACRRFMACKNPFSREVSFGLDSPIASWARCFASSINLSPLSKPIWISCLVQFKHVLSAWHHCQLILRIACDQSRPLSVKGLRALSNESPACTSKEWKQISFAWNAPFGLGQYRCSDWLGCHEWISCIWYCSRALILRWRASAGTGFPWVGLLSGCEVWQLTT